MPLPLKPPDDPIFDQPFIIGPVVRPSTDEPNEEEHDGRDDTGDDSDA
jgi:hypothetical protein